MIKLNSERFKFSNNKIIVFGIILGFLFWNVESLIHYIRMGGIHDPFSHLLHTDPYELWRRISFILFILSISIIIQNSINKFTNYKIILIGTLLVICFWIIEAFFHTFIFNINSNFIDNLLFPPVHELWMRIIVLFILMGFSILSQSMINKLHDMHKKLLKVENDLRESYNHSRFYKDLFTHDVNNIFQVINSSAEILSNYLNNPNKLITIKDYPVMIKHQIERGSKLINNILQLFELEEVERSIQKLEIKHYLNQAINYVKEAYLEKEIKIQIDVTDDKYYILANEHLVDIFENILINAIKYNENLTVEISIKLFREHKDIGEFIKLEFVDNGIGISDKKKEIIFEKNNRRYKGMKGMGLGLSLVKKLIDSYNGYIWVENRVSEDYSKGSNFVILLPKAS